jgi:hypothetical protein
MGFRLWAISDPHMNYVTASGFAVAKAHSATRTEDAP